MQTNLKFFLIMTICSLFATTSCSNNTNDVTLGNSSSGGEISIGLNQLEDLLSTLSLNFKYRDLEISDEFITNKELNPAEPIFFLKVSHDLCEPCLIQGIETLKAFKKTNPGKQTVLVVGLDPEQEKFFLPQFDLAPFILVNLHQSAMSELDSLKIDYFGVIEHQRITEIFPIHQLVNDSLYSSFLHAYE